LNLSLSNIMFTDNWDCKVADQFFRQWKSGLNKDVCKMDEAALVKEYGLVLWQLITEQDATAVRKGEAKLTFPTYCPTKLQDLILTCYHVATSNAKFSNFVDTKFWDDIFLEAIEVGKKVGNEIWATFGEAEHVSWSKFLRAFCTHLNIIYDASSTEPTLEEIYLMAMMGCEKSSQNTVYRKNFTQLFACIGPFIDGSEILDQVKALMETNWFMGNLDASKAEKMLANMPDKSFLVRFSPTSGDFSITFKEARVLHTRVPNNARFNLHNYVQMLIAKKSFKNCPPSPFSVAGEGIIPQLHQWKFIR